LSLDFHGLVMVGFPPSVVFGFLKLQLHWTRRNNSDAYQNCVPGETMRPSGGGKQNLKGWDSPGTLRVSNATERPYTSASNNFNNVLHNNTTQQNYVTLSSWRTTTADDW